MIGRTGLGTAPYTLYNYTIMYTLYISSSIHPL